MPLAAGRSLSFFEILGPLGAGWMGEGPRFRMIKLRDDEMVFVLNWIEEVRRLSAIRNVSVLRRR
jgi:hypothetical protein